MPFVILATVVVLFRWLLRPFFNLRSSKHCSCPVQGPGRNPPDPDLQPRHLMNKQGLWLHWSVWNDVPASTPSKGVIVLVHGLAEHVGRYHGTAAWLNKQGYVVYMMEHQGHGSSEGDRKYVEQFSDYVDDQEQFVRQVVLPATPDAKKRFLIGHSLGGLITSHLSERTSSLWDGVVLSGPLLKPDPEAATPVIVKVATILSRFLPKLEVKPINPDAVSTNVDVVTHYKQDPTVPTTGIRARFGKAVFDGMAEINAKAPSYKLPILILHGDQDKLCAIEGSEEFIANCGSKDKQFIKIPKAYHEILNEPKPIRDGVRAHIEKFLATH